MEHLLFYYSGTGNSLYDAILMGKKLGDARLISMRHAENKGKCYGECETLGFVFPVHHGGMPKAVMQFIEEIEITKASYVYSIVTCGAWDMCCISELEKILQAKGIPLDYSVVHENVNSNITSIFPNIYNIEQNVRADGELEKHIARIVKRKKGIISKGKLFAKLHNTVLPKVTRLAENRRVQFQAGEDCDQCGICAKVCGSGNIQMVNGKPEFQNNCEKCLSCIQYCPRAAINIVKLTEQRQRYHHPFVSASRIAKSQIIIEKGHIVEHEK